MYRPKFCAECGVKVIRLRWHSWHSRRFCAPCAPLFQRRQAIRLVIAGVVVLLLGITIGHWAQSPVPPLVIQRSQEPQSNTHSETASGTTPAGSKTNVPPPATEEVYMCGARTKKGTPCTRRVHGPVRCWQHKGVPAMLAQEKLRIKE